MDQTRLIIRKMFRENPEGVLRRFAVCEAMASEKPGKSRVDEFVDTVRSWGYPNPLVSGEILLHGGGGEDDWVGVQLREWEGKVVLQHIHTLKRGVGSASKILRDLTDLADQLGVEILLIVRPFGKGGLSQQALGAWYSRYGFEPTDLEDTMVYRPVVSDVR